MMTNTIKNQDGRLVYKKEHVAKVLDMLHNGEDTGTVDGKTITIVRDHRKDSERTTTVEIEEI